MGLEERKEEEIEGFVFIGGSFRRARRVLGWEFGVKRGGDMEI